MYLITFCHYDFFNVFNFYLYLYLKIQISEHESILN